MKIEFEMMEETEHQPLSPDDLVSAVQDHVLARMVIKFDGDPAIELYEAKWTMYPAAARLKEAAEALKEAEMAHNILRKLLAGSEAPANRYIALGANRLDLNVSRVVLTSEEDMYVSRLMKR